MGAAPLGGPVGLPDGFGVLLADDNAVENGHALAAAGLKAGHGDRVVDAQRLARQRHSWHV